VVIIQGMKPPIFIRPFTQDERQQVQAGLRSSDAFVLRRCQILLASARGERAPVIARQLACDDQTVRNVIKGFNAHGLAVLKEGSSRPHRLRTTFTEEGAERLKDLLHRSPRDFGQDRSTWTLELAAQVSFEQGIISREVSDESVRRALKRLKTNWKRAKHWNKGPDPQYLQKKLSGQRLRRSDSSPARLKSSEIALTLVKETKALELLALSRSGFPS
jgi:transposase